MAISDIYNSLTFGGVNSLDYGIYISGPGVFDAPVRAVEFVDVPGRNGAIEIDKGHWNNIEVTYKAGTFGDDQSDFAQRINAFRNAIVSQIGYQRITDTYNPEEYRLGIYASGLSVDPANRNSAGEFDLVFNCKPQRYLLEGENEITVTSGQTITNPTLYESGPLVAVEGYGNLSINDYDILVIDAPLGLLIAQEQGSISGNSELTKTFAIPSRLANSGDPGTLKPSSFSFEISTASNFQIIRLLEPTIADYPNASAKAEIKRGNTVRLTVETPEETFSVGSAFGKIGEVEVRVEGRLNGVETIESLLFNFRIRQTSSTLEWKLLNIDWSDRGFLASSAQTILDVGSVEIISSVSILGHPTMIDLEIGDAFKIENGEYIDLNKYIALPSDLPKLKPGENEITFDNTITELKITPRWWEL